MILLDQALNALLNFRLTEWHGLVPCFTADIAQLYDTPFSVEDVYLGLYPALRETYALPESTASGLVIYSRAHRVIAVETIKPPPLAVMDELGHPDVRKPPELTIPDYLIREYLYCRNGLVLSVAESLNTLTEPNLKIVRCRGIAVLKAPHEYGVEFYLPLQSSLVFE